MFFSRFCTLLRAVGASLRGLEGCSLRQGGVLLERVVQQRTEAVLCSILRCRRTCAVLVRGRGRRRERERARGFSVSCAHVLILPFQQGILYWYFKEHEHNLHSGSQRETWNYLGTPKPQTIIEHFAGPHKPVDQNGTPNSKNGVEYELWRTCWQAVQDSTESHGSLLSIGLNRAVIKDPRLLIPKAERLHGICGRNATAIQEEGRVGTPA
jgi:hypothetical protein